MIEKAIHEIINDASLPDAVALLALLPAERIVTGINHDRDLPYASINLESNAVEYRSNAGSMRAPRVRIQVWHDNHLVGSQIREAFEKLFDNLNFDASTEDVVQIRHDNSFTIQEPDGTWQFTIDIEIKTTKKG